MHLLILSLAVALQARGPGDAWGTMRDVQRAVESGTAAAAERRWRSAAPDRRSRLALATLARLTYQYERADSLLDQVVRGESGVTDYLAAAHLSQAAIRAFVADVVAADSLLSRARAEAAASGDWHIGFQALIGLSKVRSRRVGPKAAVELVRQARVLLDRPTADELALASCSEGGLLEQLGDSTGRRLIQSGIRTAERGSALRELGACELVMAQTAERIGYFVSATHYALVALEHFTAVHNGPGLAAASQWLGYARLVRGYFAGAKVDLERAILASQLTRYTTVEAWARANLAELHLALGDVQAAREQAERAATLHAALGDQWGLAIDLQFQGRAAEARHQLDEASAKYTESVAAFRRAGLAFNALSSLRMLALVNMSMGRVDSAQRVLDEATRLARSSGNLGWQAEGPVHLARLAMLRGDLHAADTLLTMSRPRYEWRRAAESIVAVSFAALEAQLALRLHRPATADSATAFISSAIEGLREGMGDGDLRAGLAQLRSGWGSLSDAYPEIVAGLVAAGHTASAFRFVESLRGREIAEGALRAVARIPDSSAALTEFRRLVGQSSVTSLDAVRRRMARDEAFVEMELGVGGAPTTAIVVTSDSVAAVSLPGRDVLAPQIDRYLQVISSGVEPVAVAHQLGAALIQPIVDLLPSRIVRLSISPDGDLFRVPFDVLRLSDGRFVVERIAVSLVPSATVATMLAARPVSRSAIRLVAIGDPAFSPAQAPQDPRGRATQSATPTRFAGLTLNRLPQSAEEVRRVARYSHASVVWTRQDATEAMVRKFDWSTVGVVHFATHALVDADGQAHTALALSPSGADDGFLTSAELASLRLNGALVVLSSCQSLGGQILGGEGLRGLAAPLLEAGARAIVVTHWSIGDRGVLPYVDRLYAAMAEGRSVGEAVRLAKLAAIHDGVPIGDWGAFAVIGDATMRPPLQPPRSSPLDWLRGATKRMRDTSTSPLTVRR